MYSNAKYPSPSFPVVYCSNASDNSLGVPQEPFSKVSTSTISPNKANPNLEKLITLLKC